MTYLAENSAHITVGENVCRLVDFQISDTSFNSMEKPTFNLIFMNLLALHAWDRFNVRLARKIKVFCF